MSEEEEDKDEIEIVHHDENDYLIAYAYAIGRHDEKAEVKVVPICKIIFFFTILQSYFNRWILLQQVTALIVQTKLQMMPKVFTIVRICNGSSR